MGKNIGKSVSENLSGKYSQRLLDHTKQPATDPFKTASKTLIQKTAEATRPVSQSNSDTATQTDQKSTE